MGEYGLQFWDGYAVVLAHVPLPMLGLGSAVISDSSRPHGLQPTRLLRPWDFPPHIQGKRNPSKTVGTERGFRGQTD